MFIEVELCRKKIKLIRDETLNTIHDHFDITLHKIQIVVVP